MPLHLPIVVKAGAVGRTVVGLLTLAFLLLAFSVTATGWMIRRTERDNDMIDHRHVVRMLTNRILTDAIRAESGQRGYLLTGDRYHRDVVLRATQRLNAELERLRRLVANEPRQLRRVDALRTHVDTKLSEVQRSIALYEAGRPLEAIDLVRSEAGRVQMRQGVRAIIAEFDADESAMLAQRRRSAELANRTTLAANFGSAILIVAVGAISVALVRRYIHELRASRAELDRLNRGLEATVEARTRELTGANAELARARDRAETLLREVNHRVANSLQLVSSFIQLQAKALTEETANPVLDETLARIQAVAQIHRRLYTSSDVECVDLKDYLTALAEELQHSITPLIRIKVDAEPLRASTDRAVSLGVVVAELATNAVKYAYPEDEAGEVRIRLAAAGGGRAVVTVEDDGGGMGQGPPKGTGVGGRIISAMASALGSEVEYDLGRERGLRARLEFAVS